MNKILFIDTVHHSLAEILINKGFQCTDGSKLSKEEILNQINLCDGLIIRSRFKIDKSFLDSCNRIKFIARFGAGMENIDVEYAESIGIRCFHAAKGNKDAVGEHAIAMLLNLFNNINKADKEVRQSIWKREENRGIELMGKTVAIIGFGNMGSAFAERLSGFGITVLAYDKYKTNYTTKIPYVKETNMQEIYKFADIVSIHLPLTKETEYLVNKEWINKFTKQIYIINTARGKVLNTSDAVNLMIKGKIKGMCLDVLEYEDTSFEHINNAHTNPVLNYLYNSDKVVLTPHIAGWTHESNAKIAVVLGEQIIKFVQE